MIEPLSAAYRRAYWAILVGVAIAMIGIVMRGFIPLPGGMGILFVAGAVVALRADHRLRSVASLDTPSVSPSPDKMISIGKPLGDRLVSAPRPLSSRHVIILGLIVTLALVLFPPWQVRVITRTKTEPWLSVHELIGMAYGVRQDTVPRIGVDTSEWTIPFASILAPPEVDFYSFRKRAVGRIMSEVSPKGRDSVAAAVLVYQREESLMMDRAHVPLSLRTERPYLDTLGGREYEVTYEDGVVRKIAYERLIFTVLCVVLVTSIAALALSYQR